jgi:hypothetical protein
LSQVRYDVHSPICSLIKSVTDASFVLLTAVYPTGVVSSSILSTAQAAALTARLQKLLAAAPVLADIEAGFAGLVRSTFAATMFEAGSFTVDSVYAAPTCTVTLNGITDPAHVAVALPFSTSSPAIGAP